MPPRVSSVCTYYRFQHSAHCAQGGDVFRCRRSTVASLRSASPCVPCNLQIKAQRKSDVPCRHTELLVEVEKDAAKLGELPAITNHSESRSQNLHLATCNHFSSVPAGTDARAAAGLNALGLSISRVQVDGQDAEFDLHTYLHGPLPASLTGDPPGAAALPLSPNFSGPE